MKLVIILCLSHQKLCRIRCSLLFEIWSCTFMHDTTTPLTADENTMRKLSTNLGVNDWKSNVSSLLRIQAFKWFLGIELQLKYI